jgi:hypothetical protein
MYRNFSQLREGWTKNLALLFPSPARLAALRTLEFVLIAASLGSSIASALRGHREPAVVAGILAVTLYAFFLARIRQAHSSWDANILALFGLPMFSYLLLRSKKIHATGNVNWKGRKYSEQLATGH